MQCRTGLRAAGSSSVHAAAVGGGGGPAPAAAAARAPVHHHQRQHHHHAADPAHCPRSAAGLWGTHRALPAGLEAAMASAAEQLAAASPPAAGAAGHGRSSLLPLVTVPGGSEEQQQQQDFANAAAFHERFTMTGETLGQGTYGTVRVCTDISSGQQYAVKILPKTKQGEDRTASIAREVHLWRKLAAVAPQHIVGFVAAYQDANNVFIVQEYMTGGDLQALLDEQGVLPEPVAAAAMRGVLQVLDVCHSVDVAYGDVKPANFMLARLYPSLAHRVDPAGTPPGDVAVRAIDFGCAQYCPDGCQLIQGLSGTPVYIAPEVISQHCYSMHMDVWSAGVVMYNALSGQFPFWDTNLAGLSRLHPRRVIENVRDLPVIWDTPALAALSPAALDLLRRMLEKDPARRITAAEALAHPWLQQ